MMSKNGGSDKCTFEGYLRFNFEILLQLVVCRRLIAALFSFCSSALQASGQSDQDYARAARETTRQAHP